MRERGRMTKKQVIAAAIKLKDEPKYFEIYRKVMAVEELPRQEECARLMERVDKRFGEQTYAYMLARNGYFQVVHDKLIADLKKLTRKLGTQKNLEICSGWGKISYHLNKSGVEIKATDKKGSKHVEGLNHRRALEKYNPDFVIASSPPLDSIVFDTLRHKSVKHLLVIAKGSKISILHGSTIARLAKSSPVDLSTFPSCLDGMYGSGWQGNYFGKRVFDFSMSLLENALFTTYRQD
ncbi:MAG: hypothetical protein KGH61_02240 [Candidatus Micrarchaeota archaeon]|nr:hypothetical protein [Candidatus Micrarchaeota archaeon]MDE1847748.1 hypothetical protein [Candidatus Micrarchaeota archaeon]MDE1863891.1 hypothetical protein [Candidatus Micrarchaeota archaeon]